MGENLENVNYENMKRSSIGSFIEYKQKISQKEHYQIGNEEIDKSNNYDKSPTGLPRGNFVKEN